MNLSGPKREPNAAKIDWLMSAERDLPPRAGAPVCRYLLCSTARCGSNLVSDMLRQTGLAGDPLEYLNPRYFNGECRRFALDPARARRDVEAYLDGLEKRRTSANGWFGCKAHFAHLAKCLSSQPQLGERLLRRFDRFVVLRRHDKLAQAVSHHRASVTQVWSSLDERFMPPDDPRRRVTVPYDATRISRSLATILEQEQGWERCLRGFGLPFEVFWYEDFVADYRGTSARLLAVLGIPQGLANVSAPTLQRQGRDDDPLLLQFRQTLGLGRG
ncbi:MAG: hypothetical protein FGM40_07255 [Rhodocyclaceae bacterium]|nr:hypothetical protein [Rhodocyclaceae bacterium]